MTRWKANALLLTAGAIWGLAFIAQIEGLDHVGPFLFVGLRFLIATAVLLPFAVHEAKRARLSKASQIRQMSSLPHANESHGEVLLDAAHGHIAMDAESAVVQDGLKAGREHDVNWIGFISVGVALFFGMAFQQVGLMTTSVTNSGFLTGLYVVFTPVLGLLLYQHRPHPIVWVGALLCFLGIFLLSGGQFERLVQGDYLTLVSAIFWALQVVLIARVMHGSNRVMALALVQFLVTGVLGLAVALVIEPFDWQAISGAMPSLLYAGVIAGGLAFTLQVVGQRHTTAPQAVLFLATEAPFAALFGYLLRDERVGWLGVAGCALILAAILLVELVPLLRRKVAR